MQPLETKFLKKRGPNVCVAVPFGGKNMCHNWRARTNQTTAFVRVEKVPVIGGGDRKIVQSVNAVNMWYIRT